MGRLQRRSFLAALGVSGAFRPYGVRAAEAYTLRITFPQPETSAVAIVAFRLASMLQRRTNGQVKLEVFPNGSLIAQSDAVNATITGVIDFMIYSTNFFEAFLPRFEVLGLPFLFKTVDSGHRVLDGPIGQALFAESQAKGILGYGCCGAFREIFTANKIIATPADAKGLRVRMVGGALGAAMYQALGAVPVTIDLSETFVALSQHVIDGIDIITDGFTSSKWYTAAKRANLTNHIFSINVLAASRRKIEAMPAPLQQAVRDESMRIIPFWRSLIVKQTADDIELLKKNGVSVGEADFAAFRKLMDPIYANLQNKLGGDLVTRVTRAAAAG